MCAQACVLGLNPAHREQQLALTTDSGQHGLALLRRFPAPATPLTQSRYVYTHVPIFLLKTVEINYLTGAGCEKAGVHLDTEAHLQPHQATSPSALSG